LAVKVLPKIGRQSQKRWSRNHLTTGAPGGCVLKMKVICNSAVLGIAALASTATATPRRLPFTYPNETLPEGGVEIETYVDVNPLRTLADEARPADGNVWAPEYTIQTEFEYGLTERWELGFYEVFKADPQGGGGNVLGFDGLKWRIRNRLAEPGQLPVDIGFYLELETMHDELALEGKVNLQRRIGHFTWMANLWVEEAVQRPFDTKAHGRETHFVVNPTTGVVLQVTPAFHPGIEFWARGQLRPRGDTAQEHRNQSMHYFVGPTTHINFGRLWWSAGLYLHANRLEAPRSGDAYGPIWFRTVLGLEL
jgi:hypothetical protein